MKTTFAGQSGMWRNSIRHFKKIKSTQGGVLFGSTRPLIK